MRVEIALPHGWLQIKFENSTDWSIFFNKVTLNKWTGLAQVVGWDGSRIWVRPSEISAIREVSE